MSIAIDGFDILQRLGKHAEAFAAVRTEVNKQARALVVKCLKVKTISLDVIHSIHQALGREQFELLVEGLKDAEVKIILTRLDKHHPDMKEANSSWRRQHLNALAADSHRPTSAPAKAAKKRAKNGIGKKSQLDSEAMAIYREGDKKKK